MCPSDSTQDLPQDLGDRGDDLLEPTRFSPKLSSTSSEDQVQSAEILLGEGLSEEAKKILHAVLIGEPSHTKARALLNQIHEKELQTLLSGDDSEERRRRKILGKTTAPPLLGPIDPDEIIRNLDRDLGLGLAGLSLLSEAEQGSFQEFASQLEKSMIGASYQDRVDMGVGFFQMDLYHLAAAQWAAAERMGPPTERDRVGLAALQGLALVLSNRGFEAASCLQPVLRDQEIAWDEKHELVYLMGRAAQSQGDLPMAISWYERLMEHDPQYRDVFMRLERIKTKG